MNKKIFIPLIILSILSIATAAAALLSGPEGALGQEQQERPKFYAKRILFEQNVKDADKALGAPDGRYAEIGVGGHLIILMEDRIFPSPSDDDGFVVLKGEANFGLAGWLPIGDDQNGTQYFWMIMVPGQGGGFRLTVRKGAEGTPGVNMLRIMNDDTKPIYLDALVGYRGRVDGDKHEGVAGRGPLW
ncbi:MAG: hypothetical protein ABFD80_03690 [Acidobacteriota bacterium]